MKYLNILFLLLGLSIVHEATAQAKSDKGHFLVELEQFTPPVQDMIKSFEGFPATPFLANDMSGVERFLGDFKGKVCVLYFWNKQNSDAVALLYDLNQMKKKLGKKVAVVAMGDDTREDITEFLGEKQMDIMVIPNTRMLSEAVYGVELGYPRMFIIDQSGIIRAVIPEDYFKAHGDHPGIINSAVKAYL